MSLDIAYEQCSIKPNILNLSENQNDWIQELINTKKSFEVNEILKNSSVNRINLNHEILWLVFKNAVQENSNLTQKEFIETICRPESRRELLNKLSKKGTIPKINSKESYEENLKHFVLELENSLWLNNWIIWSVIEQESMYWAFLNWNKWSKWLMQLNNAPLEDMKKYPSKYIKYFAKIPENIINKVTPIEAKDLIFSIINENNNNKPDYKKISLLFEKLNSYIKWFYKNNDLLNTIFWWVYLAFCNERKSYSFSKKWEWSIKEISENELNKISHWEIIKWLTIHKWYIVNNEQEEKIRQLLSYIKNELRKDWENDIKKEYLSLREYNWSSKKNKYAISVMIANRFNNLT